MSAAMGAGTAGVRGAVRRGEYELAALRLALGVLEALEQGAPRTRDDLLSLLAGEDAATTSSTTPRQRRGRA